MTEPIQKKVWGMSLEFVLQLGAMLVAITVAYTALDNRSKYTETGLIDVKGEVIQLKAQVRDVETSQVRLDERFVNIMTLLTQINERLERAEGRN